MIHYRYIKKIAAGTRQPNFAEKSNLWQDDTPFSTSKAIDYKVWMLDTEVITMGEFYYKSYGYTRYVVNVRQNDPTIWFILKQGNCNYALGVNFMALINIVMQAKSKDELEVYGIGEDTLYRELIKHLKYKLDSGKYKYDKQMFKFQRYGGIELTRVDTARLLSFYIKTISTKQKKVCVQK